MELIRITDPVNITLLAAVVVLSASHYARFRRVVFLLIAGGALLFIGKLLFSAFRIESAGRLGLIWISAIDAAGLFFWMLASIHGARRAGFKLIAWATIYGVIVLYALIPAAAGGKPPAGPDHSLLFLAYQLCLAAYCLTYILVRRVECSHYLFQGFLFAGVAVASLIYAQLSGTVTQTPMTVSALAYTFAFISMLLFSDACAKTALEEKIETGDLKAKLVETFSSISRQLRLIPDELGREEIFTQGTSIIGEALFEQLGFKSMYFGRRSEGGPGFFFEDCLNRHPDGLPVRSFRAVDPILDEVKSTHRPVIVADSCRDPRALELSFGRTGMNSFIALPVIIRDKLQAIVLLGNNNGIDAFKADETLVEFIAEQVSLCISYLNLRSEILTAPETDAVTLLRNFSSFQRLLADSIDEADKTGATLALIRARRPVAARHRRRALEIYTPRQHRPRRRRRVRDAHSRRVGVHTRPDPERSARYHSPHQRTMPRHSSHTLGRILHLSF